MTKLIQLESKIKSLVNKEKAKTYQSFFKTGKGEYGDGDFFLGLSVPTQRKLAKEYILLPLSDIKKLLYSKYHEHRLTAIFILVYKYEKNPCKEILEFYLENKSQINNWDLVDSSAHKILGKSLLDKEDRKILYDLANSKNLWDKRISIISTFEFIKNNQFKDTIKISKILLNDSHDLIQKAVGWMLREVGKKDEKILKDFLKENYKKMPRTMLRYSIEKFPKELRTKYLEGNI